MGSRPWAPRTGPGAPMGQMDGSVHPLCRSGGKDTMVAPREALSGLGGGMTGGTGRLNSSFLQSALKTLASDRHLCSTLEGGKIFPCKIMEAKWKVCFLLLQWCKKVPLRVEGQEVVTGGREASRLPTKIFHSTHRRSWWPRRSLRSKQTTGTLQEETSLI